MSAFWSKTVERLMYKQTNILKVYVVLQRALVHNMPHNHLWKADDTGFGGVVLANLSKMFDTLSMELKHKK